MSRELAPARGAAGRPELPLWLPARRSRDEARGEAQWRLARLLNDVLALLIAGGVSGATDAPSLQSVLKWGLLALVVITLAAAGAYRRRRRLRFGDELRRVIGGIGLACIAIGAAAVAIDGRTGIGDTMAIQWLVASTLAATGRLALFGGQRVSLGRGSGEGRTLIVGAGRVGRLTARRLLDEPQLRLQPIGFLDKEPLDGDERDGDWPLPVLGASWDLERVVEEHGVDTVVIAFSTAPHHVLLNLVRRAWKLGADVMVVPRLYEVEGRRIRTEHLGGLPLVAIHAADPDSLAFTVKYAFDRIVAGVALLLLAPVLAVGALTVLCALGRPILFRQQRAGRDGHVFDMLKLRTMHGAPNEHGEADAAWAEQIVAGNSHQAEGASDAADRRSRVGDVLRKVSLDELPQLWNVVRGDMSLVGPRPERVHYVELFEQAIYRYPDRHRVKSGLTGWAQVNGLRGETSLADRIEWDNFYIENWSPWLDLKILVKTIPALLPRRSDC